jgi:hypothetical protein
MTEVWHHMWDNNDFEFENDEAIKAWANPGARRVAYCLFLYGQKVKEFFDPALYATMKKDLKTQQKFQIKYHEFDCKGRCGIFYIANTKPYNMTSIKKRVRTALTKAPCVFSCCKAEEEAAKAAQTKQAKITKAEYDKARKKYTKWARKVKHSGEIESDTYWKCKRRSPVGCTEGSAVGCPEGSPVGCPEGSPLGCPEGSPVGCPDGSPVGCPEGSPVGCPEGSPEAPRRFYEMWWSLPYEMLFDVCRWLSLRDVCNLDRGLAQSQQNDHESWLHVLAMLARFTLLKTDLKEDFEAFIQAQKDAHGPENEITWQYMGPTATKQLDTVVERWSRLDVRQKLQTLTINCPWDLFEPHDFICRILGHDIDYYGWYYTGERGLRDEPLWTLWKEDKEALGPRSSDPRRHDPRSSDQWKMSDVPVEKWDVGMFVYFRSGPLFHHDEPAIISRRPKRRPCGVWKVSLRWHWTGDNPEFLVDCKDVMLDLVEIRRMLGRLRLGMLRNQYRFRNQYPDLNDIPVKVLYGAHEGVQGTVKEVLGRHHELNKKVVLNKLPGIKFEVTQVAHFSLDYVEDMYVEIMFV